MIDKVDNCSEDIHQAACNKKISKYSSGKRLKCICLSQVEIDVGRKTSITRLLCTTRLLKTAMLLSYCSGPAAVSCTVGKRRMGDDEKQLSFKDRT